MTQRITDLEIEILKLRNIADSIQLDICHAKTSGDTTHLPTYVFNLNRCTSALRDAKIELKRLNLEAHDDN